MFGPGNQGTEMVSFTWKGRRYHTDNRLVTAVMAVPVILALGLLALVLVGSAVAVVGFALMAVSSLIVTGMVIAAGQKLLDRLRRP